MHQVLNSAETAQEDSADTWKGNAPYLYDLCVLATLTWPSFTVDWLTRTQRIAGDADCVPYKCVLGTATEGQEQDHLVIAEVKLPLDSCDESNVGLFESSDDFQNQPEYLANTLPAFRVTAKLPHPGDVNRALHMPQNPFNIATKCSDGSTLLFDYSKHESFSNNQVPKPDLRLQGHKSEGFGLSWSTQNPGMLLSASYDGRICLWDVSAKSDGSNIWPMKHILSSADGTNADVLNDCCFNPLDSSVFLTVDDAGATTIWDSRLKNRSIGCIKVQASQEPLLAVSVNPFAPHYVAVGGDDKTIKLLDVRYEKAPFYTLKHHSGEVRRVHWSPSAGGVIASGSADSTVILWNLKNLGKENDSMDNNEVVIGTPPKEVMFVHCGHTAPVNDLAFNINEVGLGVSNGRKSKSKKIHFCRP
eukprot:Selendium_serpulae@DN5907_c0_g1_i3.p1